MHICRNCFGNETWKMMDQHRNAFLTLTLTFLLFHAVEGTRRLPGFIKVLGTYNTALLEWTGTGSTVPSRTERRDAIIELLNSTYAHAHVMCLQEVYFGEDLYRIAKDLEDTFPYSFSPTHTGTGTSADDIPMEGLDSTPPCPAALFLPFAGCLQTNCPDASDYEALAGCIVSYCAAEFAALPQECWTCFASSGTDFAVIVQSCTDASPELTGPYRQVNMPGLLLLSRTPLREPTYTDLHPGTREVYEIGYLEATVGSDVKVVCTHTTFYESDVYYELELQAIANITSWVQQGRLEISTLVERFKDEQRVFMLGDWNVGPGNVRAGIVPVHADLFSLLTDAFCVDPLPVCTYCDNSDNVYNGNSTETARIIDHIFYKGFRSIWKRRIFDDVTVVNGYPVSDHFGMMEYFLCKPSFGYRACRNLRTTRRRKYSSKSTRRMRI